MKPLLRVGVPLWCLLVSSALLKVCQTNSTNESYINQTETYTTAATPTTTSAKFTAVTSGLAYNTSTVPGTVNPPTTNTTPAAVTALHVTEVTTSSVSLNWTNTAGKLSSFKVQWTDGTNILFNLTTKTSYTITNLMSGVRYNVTVSVDGQTEGKGQTVSRHTRPGKVVLRSVDTNTSSISLDWNPPPGLNFMYRVEWNSGENAGSMQTVESSAVLLDLIPGTNYTIMITVVVGDNVTGEPYTFSAVTKPAAVGNLTVTDVTTSSVSLSWAQPEGKVTWYIVRWAGSKNTTAETSFVITNLTPGSQYNISVAAVAGVASNEGDGASTVTFTRPEKPENITLTSRGTDYLSIRWSLLKGKFQYFRVNVSEADSRSVYYNETKANSADIIGLGPGRIFAITVSTIAGNFAEASEEYQFATLPNPPGSIISWKTNSSLTLEWATPALMDGTPNVSYYVAYQSSGKEMQNITTSVNRTELSNLSSGTFYNITLRTIGIKNLESTAVYYSTCTRPNPVLNLVASPRSTSSLEVQWSYPQGAQTHYTYFVLGPKVNTTVGTNSTEILNLDPGTKYRITVKTIAGAAECDSTEAETHAYTMPQAVTNLTVVAVQTMAVRLAWLRPSDYKTSYSYLVAGRQASAVVQNYTTDNETLTFPNLTPGESYHFDVFTVVEGVKSEVKSISSDTKPAPATNVTVTGSTTNLSVGWSAAVGHVVSYTVLLYRDGRLEASHENLDNRTVNAAFTNRTPGVYYCVVVVSKTRSFETNSSEVCRATVPNPPGSIFVESQNIHFINFSWPLPNDMDHQQYNFSVSSFKGPFITKNNWFFLDGLQSGSLYNISVATLGVSNYESVAVVAANYTRPYPVHNLTEEQATTTTVNLSWEQLEGKPHYSYVVQASNGSIFWSETVYRTSASVTGLIPGSRYSFTVISQTADGTQATPVELSSYTQPDRVEPSVSSQGSNSSLLVSWRPALGRLEHYSILLNHSFPQDIQELQVANTSNHHIFGNLFAGRLYSVQITVYSGPKKASSGFVFNATFPNPPGPLDILAKTNNSIDVKWQEAPLMTVGSFHYRLSITPPGGGVNISLTNTSHSFAPLLSGTPYNISVLTVGALGFESEEVQIYMVNTKPYSVKNLRVYSLGENDTTVVWDHPDDYKESYRYNVTWKSSESVSSNRTLKNTSYISDLVPGSLYHFFVTTETFDGTKADPQWISSCTDASPVSGLQCQGPNTKDATLLMSWVRPRGQYSAFQVLLNDNERISSTNICCSHNETNLHHYTNYKLTVETQSCGQPGIAVSQKCWTGVTDPPIVQDFKPLVDVTETTHNRFSIQIHPRLLNNTNGPVTHVGVLVTVESPGNTSTWRAYLGKTYDEWKKSQATVYLAAVKTISGSRSAGIHHTLQVGDESQWEGYTNGALNPGQKYHYAVVVFTNLSLENNLVNGEKSLVSSTSFSLFVVLHGDPVIGIAVGATVGIFFVLFVILLGFIFYWRRLSRKEETDIQIHSMRPKVSVAVRMEDYEVYYRKQKADSNCGFAEEFEDLRPVGTDQSKNVASVLENKPKNRYNNVLPYDSSRVKLSIIHGSPYDDYINANYMPGYNSKKEFIAAQGPLPGTVKDFWRMIWEKNVQTVVMLTRCNEQGRVKCEQYWDYGTKRFENINVTSVSDIPLEDWTIRDFDIKNVKTAETRSVRQFHFTAWPDHGVPETTELLISFRHLVREHMDQYSRHSPTVVHCSAGVGRTGTFIAIDRLIFQIERENIVDVYGVVHDLRMHRPLMVQTEDQYVFLNQCAMDIIRSRTGNNVDLIYQNTAALSIYENVEPQKGYYRYPDA